jgi:prevent-host-death family protein
MNVGVLEAKNRFSELLELAAEGEEVVITKHGQPFIRLQPVQRRPSASDVDALVARVRERRRRLALKLTDEDIKAAIEKGRA